MRRIGLEMHFFFTKNNFCEPKAILVNQKAILQADSSQSTFFNSFLWWDQRLHVKFLKKKKIYIELNNFIL
ncbi:unnamed protein product [Blepharisma stoltei]|uniref:Uncharacterized protein n=1 Tax=Blepharisma stoltei TaxID=1481888 RepID=A0AAU9J691_9CILI|nr:unnamed protein product [Blepharisma stoltei]